jgi:hypothetical protein
MIRTNPVDRLARGTPVPGGTPGRPALSRQGRVLLIDNLNAVLGFANLLAEAEHLDPTSRRYARNIQVAGERLLSGFDREEDVVRNGRSKTSTEEKKRHAK